MSECSGALTTCAQSDQMVSSDWVTDVSSAMAGKRKNLPFGERFLWVGTLSSFWYGGHEDQAGSPIYMQARMYLPAYGKFASPDPKYDQDPNEPSAWNLYVYCMNNPVTRTDPTGLEAWEVENKWDADQIKGYRQYVADEAAKLQKSGTKLTCEDFAIKVLGDYASGHGLPMSITNGSGTFSASSDKFNSKDEYINAVMKTTAASDLSNPANTARVSSAPRGEKVQFNDAKPGDLVLFRSPLPGQTRDSHVQVITGIDRGSARIAQGNTNEFLAHGLLGHSFPSSGDPTSVFYAGKPIESGTWGLGNGNYKRDGEVVKTGFAAQRDIDVRIWGFESW